MKLYLDDARITPTGWFGVKTVIEAKDALSTGTVEEISLDHDLGDGECGMDLVKWMIETHHAPKKIYIHSANVPAANEMRRKFLDAGIAAELKSSLGV